MFRALAMTPQKTGKDNKHLTINSGLRAVKNKTFPSKNIIIGVIGASWNLERMFLFNQRTFHRLNQRLMPKTAAKFAKRVDPLVIKRRNDGTENGGTDDTKCCYQLIKAMTQFEKEIRHLLYVFLKKTTVNSAKCETTARAHDAFCPLTQAWRINCPFNCPIKLSNYKRDANTVLAVLKSGQW